MEYEDAWERDSWAFLIITSIAPNRLERLTKEVAARHRNKHYST